jgi:hypothetical protein
MDQQKRRRATMNQYVHNIVQNQRYEAILREAEQRHLAREAGYQEAGALRSIAAKLWDSLAQIRSPKVTNSDEALIRRTRYRGS